MGEGSLKVVAQQPQFLPWVGLWHKVISSDVYIVYAGVKFSQAGHEHRVPLNGGWLTLPIETGQRHKRIPEVQLAIPCAPGLHKMSRTIMQTCMTRKHKHRARLDPILEILERWEGQSMFELNQKLFLAMADALKIHRYTGFLHVDVETRRGTAIENLEVCLKQHLRSKPFKYLAGGSGLNYMGYDSLKSPTETRFQKMRPGISPDSVLQLIATHDTPLDVIKASACWVTKDGRELEWDAE